MPGRYDPAQHPHGRGGQFADTGGRKKPPPKGTGRGGPASADAKSLLGVASELESRLQRLTPAQAARAKDLAAALRAKAATTGLAADAGGDKAKFVGEKVGKAEHVYADVIEKKVAGAVRGEQVGGEAASTGAGKQSHGDPLDVAVKGGHAVEVKTLLKGGKTTLSVHDDALVRKIDYADRTGDTYHTVAVDHRDRYAKGRFGAGYSGHEVYYKRGSGAYALSKMYPVKSRAELQRLVRMPEADLPEAARGSLPSDPAEVAKLRESAAKAHAARLKKDRARKARIKAAKEAAAGAKAA